MLDELISQLNEEAESLLHELNVTLPAEIEKAVAQGDLKENSEYSAALERQQFVQARLDYIARRLSEITEIDLETIPSDRVGFGSHVRVRDMEDGSDRLFVLAHGDFIDFDSSEISMASPIGKALLGSSEGDRVDVTTPGGSVRYEVVEIVTLHEVPAQDGSGNGPA